MTASSVLSSKITGVGVINAVGDDLGTVDDVLVGVGPGAPSFAIISFGGFLGLREKLYAVPLEILRIDADSGTLVLNVDQDRLKTAPSFDKDEWRLFEDGSAVVRQVRDHYLNS